MIPIGQTGDLAANFPIESPLMRELGCSMPERASIRLKGLGHLRRAPILPYQTWIEQTHDAIAKIGSSSSLLPGLAERSA